MLCFFTVSRISGAAKRSSGLCFEQNRFPLQTDSFGLFHEQFSSAFLRPSEEDLLILEHVTMLWMTCPRKTTVIVQTSGGIHTHIHTSHNSIKRGIYVTSSACLDK